MCDSDDTDFLLLIPPDFFAVHSSESEDCDCTFSTFDRNDSKIDCSIVDDLISHVKNLESRVNAIENIDSCADSSVASKNPCSTPVIDGVNSDLKYNSHMPLYENELAGTTIDSAYNSLSSRKTLSCNQPSSDVISYQNKHFSVSNTNNNDELRSPNAFISDLRFECSDRSDSLPCTDICLSSNRSQPETKELDQHKLIAEIDKYFHTCLNSSSITHDKMDNAIASLGPSLATSSSPNKFIGRNKDMQLSDLKNSIADSESLKHFELNEVGKLLNKMEKTQYEIEEKLKIRESKFQKPVPEKCHSSNAFQSGDTISSVPDLGFGLRDVYYNKPLKEPNDCPLFEDKSNGGPVIEDPCVKTRINHLGNSMKFHGKTPLISTESTDIKSQSYPKVNSSLSTHDCPESIASRFRQKLNFNTNDNLDGRGFLSKDRANSKEISSRSMSDHADFNSGQNRNNPSLNRGLEDFSSTEEKANEMVEILSQKKKRVPPRRFSNRVLRTTNGVNSRCTSSSGFDIRDNSKNRSRMMSLSDLWNNDNTGGVNESSPNHLMQKLEEEQCKRQHCEQQIHELQRKVLEQQEKLAVAVRVDQEKDNAIGQMYAGWQRLANHWNELEEQRNVLSLQLDEQNQAINAKNEELNSRKERWEKEMSQALDLAAGYKDKCQSIANEKDQLRNEMKSKIDEALARLTETEKEKLKCIEENRILLDKVAENEIDSDKDKQLISEYELKLKEVEIKLNQLEGEVSILREQKENINAKWKDEKSRSTVLEQQKTSLQNSLDELRKKEKSLKEELKNSTQRLEAERVELRAIFQSQLEAVVREKVKEFQSQLDAGLASLSTQHSSREKELAEQATQECNRLVDRHRLEIHNLEQKHRADLKLMHNKMLDIEKEKMEMKMKLDKETRRRADMAQKLHGVMETNWKQALQIIVSSPSTSGKLRNKGDGDRKKPWTDHDEKKLVEDQEDFKLELRKLMSSANGDDGSPSPDAPFNLDTGQLTYRLHANKESSNEQSHSTQHTSHQNQLKRYIQMLLERAPGHPVEDQSCSVNDSSVNSSSLADSHSSWAKFMHISNDDKPTMESSRPEQLRKHHSSKSKQPWK